MSPIIRLHTHFQHFAIVPLSQLSFGTSWSPNRAYKLNKRIYKQKWEQRKVAPQRGFLECSEMLKMLLIRWFLASFFLFTRCKRWIKWRSSVPIGEYLLDAIRLHHLLYGQNNPQCILSCSGLYSHVYLRSHCDSLSVVELLIIFSVCTKAMLSLITVHI